MITKENLIKNVNKYAPGPLRKLGVREKMSEKMRVMHDFVTSLTAGAVSTENIIQIKLILASLPTQDKKTATARNFKDILSYINSVETNTGLLISYGVNSFNFRIWSDCYYMERSRGLVGSLNEIAKSNDFTYQNTCEHLIGFCFLSANLYYIHNSAMPYVLIGKLNQSLGRSLTHLVFIDKKHLSQVLINQFGIENALKAVTLSSWLFGLTLQLGLDYQYDYNGLLTGTYIAGTLFEMLTTHLFNGFSSLSFMEKTTERFPKSLSFVRMCFEDVSYGAGAILENLYHSQLLRFFSGSKKKKSRSEHSSGKRDRAHSDSSSNQNKKHGSSSNKNNYSSGSYKQIILSSQESLLLGNSRECYFKPSQCRATAYRVFGFRDRVNPSKEDIKSVYRTLIKFWHPDRHIAGNNQAACNEQLTYINQAWDILKK